jgi:hypothetical protein
LWCLGLWHPVVFRKWLPTFWRNVLPPFAGNSECSTVCFSTSLVVTTVDSVITHETTFQKSIIHNLCLVIILYVKLKIKNIKCDYILVIVIVNILIIVVYFILIIGEICFKKRHFTIEARVLLFAVHFYKIN